MPYNGPFLKGEDLAATARGRVVMRRLGMPRSSSLSSGAFGVCMRNCQDDAVGAVRSVSIM